MTTLLERKAALHELIDSIEDESQLEQLEMTAFDFKSETPIYPAEILEEMERRLDNFDITTVITRQEMNARLDK